MKKFTQLTMLVVAMVGLSISGFAQATDLFISEYSEGSSNNKYIEIYNGTGAAVDLSDYEMWKIGNGGTWPENTMSLSGMLADGATYIFANSSSDPLILAVADTIFSGQLVYFNGDDAIGIAKDDGTGTFNLIDAVGTWGADPGSGWDVNGTTNATANHTMVRDASVCSPDTNWSTVVNMQWTVFAVNTWTDAGTHTTTCAASTSNDTINPEVIDGNFASATMVTITFSEPVTAATAQDVNNYVLTPGLTVSSAVLSASEDSVTLTIASPGFVTGTMYNVAIANVVDTSGNANMMDPFTTDFFFNSYAGTDLMITEISHSQASSGVQDIDYFEVYNSGAAAVSIAGMEVTSGVELSIDTNISIAAGAYLVFVENIDSFNLAFPSITNVVEFDNGSLSGGGETITLSNTLGAAVASVSYGTSAPWPAYSNFEAIELCDVATDYTNADNWYYSGNLASSVSTDIYGTPGMMSACATPPAVYTYDIATIRTVDANGELDSLDVYCKINGIVHGVDLDGNNGFTFVMTDATHGITIHSFSDVSNYVVTEGDELRAIGAVKTYNGLAQFRVDSIVVISTGNCIPFATVVDTLGEMTESNYIEIKNVVVADATQWPTPGNNANVDIVTTNGDTLVMRIDRDTDISDSILYAPSGMFNVIGTGGQFDNSSPYFDGYQIFPNFPSDIDTMDYAAPAGIQINEIAYTNTSAYADGNGDFYQWVELFNGSSSTINMSGYFVSTDSNNVFMERLPRCDNNTSLAMDLMSGAYGAAFFGTDGTAGPAHMMTMLDTLMPFVGLYTANGTLVNGLTYTSAIAVDGYTYGAKNDDYTVGTVTFERGSPEATNTSGTILSVISANAVNPLNVYPNPVSSGNINFNKVVSFNVYSITGQVIKTVSNVNRLDVSNLDNGVYIIKTTENEIVRVIVK